MQFQNPQFLWALFALLVPIVIHLFNLRRYKTVYFSDIRFLKEVQQDSRKQRKLKEWLVLASRLFALTALVLAFARPYLPNENQATQTKNTIIVLDNSASNVVGVGQFSPLERNRQMALALLKKLPADAQVALIHASSQQINFSTTAVVAQEVESILAVDQSFSLKKIAEMLAFQEGAATIYVFSDWQKSTLTDADFTDTNANWLFLNALTPEETNLPNCAVDSVWTDAPFLLAGQPVPLFIKLKQYGNQPADVNLELLTNGLPEIVLGIKLKANADTIVETSLSQITNGFNTAQINLLNDAAPFDDQHYLVYNIPLANHVVEIFERTPNTLIGTIFSGEEFEFTTMPGNNIDASALQKADLIILNGLENYPSGLESLLIEAATKSNLLIIPSAKNATSANALCQKLNIKTFGSLDTASVASMPISAKDPFFAEVFSGNVAKAYWPTFNKHFKLQSSSILPTYNLITLANNDPLFVRYARKNTNIFQLAASLDAAFGDLPNHPVIVPLLIKSLMKKSNLSSYTGICGQDTKFDFLFESLASEKPITLTRGDFSTIPRQQKFASTAAITVGEQIARGGFYNLTIDNTKVAEISFNKPKSESDLQRFGPEALADFAVTLGNKNVQTLEVSEANFTLSLGQWQQGTQLYKYLLIAALLFVLIEVILLRFLK